MLLSKAIVAVIVGFGYNYMFQKKTGFQVIITESK